MENTIYDLDADFLAAFCKSSGAQNNSGSSGLTSAQQASVKAGLAITGAASKRVTTGTYAATVTPNGDTTDAFNLVLTGDCTLNVPSGTPIDWQSMFFSLTASGAMRSVTLGSGFLIPSSSSATSPISIASGSETLMAAIYRASDSKWRVVSLVAGY